MSEENSIYSKFQYTKEDRIKWYTDKKGRTALCFTCAYDCPYYPHNRMRFTKCKDYVIRKEK